MGKEEKIVNVTKNPSFVIVSRHLHEIKQYEDHCQGFVDSEKKLNDFLEEFRIASGVSFITRDSDERPSKR